MGPWTYTAQQQECNSSHLKAALDNQALLSNKSLPPDTDELKTSSVTNDRMMLKTPAGTQKCVFKQLPVPREFQ
jgi:hypothetical protein